MPSKGKRVAVRESNLRRRRSNRSASGPAGVAAGAVLDGGDGGGGPAASATATATVTAASGMAAGARAGAARAASQPRGRRRERPAAYNHVGSELIRIGIFAGVALVALIAVSFVL